jgi:EAL domain-containing protein (putative c-di-GMP-specific phosphodiesterase class I)
MADTASSADRSESSPKIERRAPGVARTIARLDTSGRSGSAAARAARESLTSTQRIGVQAERAPRPAAKHGRVLVVDDDLAVGRMISRVLEGAGYEVTTVDGGSAAVDSIMHAQFDVVLSDIQMPAMSGVELLSVIRANDLDVPVILMTGEPTVETAMEAVSLGAIQYLQKPTLNETLLKAVEQACRLHKMAQMKRDALKLLGAEDDMQAGDRAGLQTRFESALESMWMAFQPILDTKRQRIFGYEALMRSREPTLPHPGALLKAAERLQRLDQLGARVRDLCAQAFANPPGDDCLLFINLHPHDLLDKALYEVDAPLTKLASRVVLEITERSAIDDVKDIQARVAVLRYHGFRIAIDDLGAGYAGLSSFVALGPEIVKLDMSLVRDVHKSEIRQRLIGSMATLCKEMGMRVVAEGVEVIEEGESVRALGCDLVQGYLYAKPGLPFPKVSGY